MESSGIKTGIVLASFLLAACLSMRAEVKLPATFSDGMVMQQQTNANLWGTAIPNKEVTVTIGWNGKQYVVTADKNGSWELSVSTPEAGGPHTITFDDGTQETPNNILIGELWLCSDQSNTETSMKGFKGQPVENANMDILRSRNPHIRLFAVKRTSTITPQDDVVGSWKKATPVSARDFSATAYYSGRLANEILEALVGLVVTTWGGSTCEAWMAADWLETFPDAKTPQSEADIKSKNRTPTVLYNGMLHPLIGMAMKGVTRYQGEDNWNRVHTHADMFTTLTNGWRAEWKQGGFPSYYRQTTPYDYGIITEKGKGVTNSVYPREVQVKVEHRVPNSGMAVLLDAGMEKGIHLAKRQVAGECLVLLASTKTYGIEGINGESPYYRSIETKNGTIVVSFEHANMWISGKNCFESKNFQVTGEDKIFYPAKAWIERSRMLVKSGKVPHPVAVCYGFENYMEGDVYCNGLPLGFFCLDGW